MTKTNPIVQNPTPPHPHPQAQTLGRPIHRNLTAMDGLHPVNTAQASRRPTLVVVLGRNLSSPRPRRRPESQARPHRAPRIPKRLSHTLLCVPPCPSVPSVFILFLPHPNRASNTKLKPLLRTLTHTRPRLRIQPFQTKHHARNHNLRRADFGGRALTSGSKSSQTKRFRNRPPSRATRK
jgi:hypothetical protein